METRPGRRPAPPSWKAWPIREEQGGARGSRADPCLLEPPGPGDRTVVWKLDRSGGRRLQVGRRDQSGRSRTVQGEAELTLASLSLQARVTRTMGWKLDRSGGRRLQVGRHDQAAMSRTVQGEAELTLASLSLQAR